MSGLTEGELSLLRGELLEARQRILARLQTRAREDRERDTDPAVLDAMDAAVQEEQRSTPHLLGEVETARLTAINDALARIDAGTYGVSERSGEPIGFRRLSIEPWARFTTEEAQEIEAARGRGRGPTL